MGRYVACVENPSRLIVAVDRYRYSCACTHTIHPITRGVSTDGPDTQPRHTRPRARRLPDSPPATDYRQATGAGSHIPSVTRPGHTASHPSARPSRIRERASDRGPEFARVDTRVGEVQVGQRRERRSRSLIRARPLCAILRRLLNEARNEVAHGRLARGAAPAHATSGGSLCEWLAHER